MNTIIRRAIMKAVVAEEPEAAAAVAISTGIHQNNQKALDRRSNHLHRGHRTQTKK